LTRPQQRKKGASQLVPFNRAIKSKKFKLACRVAGIETAGMQTNVWSENMNGREDLDDLGVQEKTVLKSKLSFDMLARAVP
jgi:hypothetical protein